MMGRHKDICGVLGKWIEVVKCRIKDGVATDSCTADLQAFLQRNAFARDILC